MGLNIDLDRLHKNYGNKDGIGSGKTWDMLIEAIQTSDFNEDANIYIIGFNLDFAKILRDYATELAKELGYEITHRHSHGFYIGSNKYSFISKRTEHHIIGYSKVIKFYDHDWDY